MMLYQNKELGGREREGGGNGKINEREEVGERKGEGEDVASLHERIE